LEAETFEVGGLASFLSRRVAVVVVVGGFFF
jgi:hypothetical protein